tara:strand:- start:1159 stop:1302 length:144 start_codon:yes stop_codon:yes gene_type:complete
MEESGVWSIEIGLYPGILIGFRTYADEEKSTHVIYVPFIDIAISIKK